MRTPELDPLRDEVKDGRVDGWFQGCIWGGRWGMLVSGIYIVLRHIIFPCIYLVHSCTLFGLAD